MISVIRVFLTLTVCTMWHLSSAQSDSQVIAHRGAWKVEGLPQNSIASLHRAIELGCAGTEFDVHLTKDDVLVVNHDADFYGIDIGTATYAELLAKKLPNGEAIPTAEAYLREGMKQQKTKLIFELKSSKLGKDRTLHSGAPQSASGAPGYPQVIQWTQREMVCIRIGKIEQGQRQHPTYPLDGQL